MTLTKTPKEIYEEQKPHGYSSRAVCAPDASLHKLRLSVAASMVCSVNPTKVIDLGCGLGHLVEALPTSLDYLGVDMTAWMVEEARKQHPNRVFLTSDIVDYLSTEAQHSEDTALVLLGVVATLTKEELPAFLAQVAQAVGKYVVLSYQCDQRYQGSFYAHNHKDILAGLSIGGNANLLARTFTDTECTILVEVP